MRYWIVLAFVLVVTGCTEHGKGGGIVCRFMGETHVPGDQFPAGDGCNSCECQSDGTVSCTEIGCLDGGIGVDGGQAACAPQGGCLGPICGSGCCGDGERCDQGVCLCGSSAPCTNGDTCEAFGPMGNDSCGSICCGVSGPCPQ